MADLTTLLERCRQGDDLAWEALIRRYEKRVYAVAYHYVKSYDEARDMAQEVFIRVYRQLHTFRGGEDMLPWLVRLTRNLCIDRLRALKARPPAEDVRVEAGAPLAGGEPSPEESAMGEARKRMLYRALDRLSEKNREIILLKEIQGLKIEEIAEMLALPVGTIKSRSSRARIELAAKLRALDPSYGV